MNLAASRSVGARPDEGWVSALTRLGVPLGQGYRLARPGPGWQRLVADAVAQPGTAAVHAERAGLWPLLEQVGTLQATGDGMVGDGDGPEIMLLDERRRPLGLLGIDDTGHFVGLVRIERLVTQLADDLR